MIKSGVVAATIAVVMLSVSYSYGGTTSIAFDNLSPTEPYYINYGTWFGTRPIDPATTLVAAIGFTPSTSGYMDELWLGMFSSATKNDFTLSLYSDNNGSLGSQLWQQRFTGAIPGPRYGTITHVSSLSTTDSSWLVAGHTYWLTAEAPDDGETYHSWYNNITGDVGLWGRSTNDVWQFESSYSRYALRVGVTPIPEPGTLSLMLGAFALGRKRGGE